MAAQPLNSTCLHVHGVSLYSPDEKILLSGLVIENGPHPMRMLDLEMNIQITSRIY